MLVVWDRDNAAKWGEAVKKSTIALCVLLLVGCSGSKTITTVKGLKSKGIIDDALIQDFGGKALKDREASMMIAPAFHSLTFNQKTGAADIVYEELFAAKPDVNDSFLILRDRNNKVRGRYSPATGLQLF